MERNEVNINPLKNYKNTIHKIANENNRKKFLVKCKHLQLIPKFIQIKQKNFSFHNNKYNDQFKRVLNIFYFQVLCIHISDSYSKLNYLNKSLEKIKTELSSSYSSDFLQNFYNNQNKRLEFISNKIKNKHLNKIDILMNQQNKIQDELTPNENWIKNLTQTYIPTHIKYILSLGPKFSFNLPTNLFPCENIISNIESTIASLNIENKEIIRNKICNILTNYKNKIGSSRKNINNQIKYYIKETKQFLKNKPNLYFLTADKCNKTVIMEKNEYISKMNNLLNDRSTYKKENHNPTNRVQSKVNNLVTSWFKRNLIPKELKNKLNCHNGHAPYIYGLPKLHKTGIPLRPIVSNIQSPTYNLSKYLSNILSNLLGKNEFYIKNSWDFCEFIKNKNIPQGHTIVSFDVVSLYTNIPIDLAIKCIENKWEQIKSFTPLTKKDFIEATKLCLTQTFFQFENSYYSQIYGVAMGSPISATIANLVMEYLEENTISQLNYQPFFFKRYVDDCILCIPENKIQYTLNKFNNFHEKIQFTMEKENNKTINFLDLTINYDLKGNIKTNWFTKEIWSGRYLNYNSIAPVKYKKSVVTALTDRAIKFSHAQFRPNNLKKIKNTLINNNYPKKFIEPIIKSRIQRHYNNNIKQKSNESSPQKYISLPYIPEITNPIKKILKPHNIQIAEKPSNNSKNFFTKLKPNIPKDEQTNVIYKINCSDCNQVYIGQTKQYLKNRVQNHKNSIRYGNTDHRTALAKHATENLHNFDFKNVEILDKENNYKKRSIKEMIHIKKTPCTMNFRTDTNDLGTVYNSLITE